MRSSCRQLLGITLMVAFSVAPAMGQEVPTPARAELGAFPAGGALFTSGNPASRSLRTTPSEARSPGISVRRSVWSWKRASASAAGRP